MRSVLQSGIYKLQLPTPENTVTLFSMKGTAIHKESDEAFAQMLAMGSGKCRTTSIMWNARAMVKNMSKFTLDIYFFLVKQPHSIELKITNCQRLKMM